MGKKVKCNHDCFNCIYDDCINDYVYPENQLYKYRTENWKNHQKAYQKKKRDEARAKGFCIVCRKRKATKGSKCLECYLRQKRFDRAKYDGKRELWRDNGLCYYCGKKPVDGKKVCRKHYDILLKNIKTCNDSENTKQSQKEFGEKYWGVKK